MKKFEILNKVKDVGIVAIIREDNPKKAIEVSKACIEGGIPAIELTYTVPNASEVIKELKNTIEQNKILIGAGSVLDSETARTAILAGSQYIVSPSFDIETAKLCNRYQVPYMPGCMTITEMVKAMEAGCDIIKLFPGSAFGPSFVKAVKGPLPQINIMPTGGVSISNVEEWIKNGVIAIGVGGQLTSGSYEEIVAKSKEFVLNIKKAREQV